MKSGSSLFLLFFFFFFVPESRGQNRSNILENDYVMGFSAMAHRVKFSGDEYNKYLKDVYKKNGADFSGVHLEFMPNSFSNQFFPRNYFSAEFIHLTYNLNFKDLNGKEKVNKIKITAFGGGINSEIITSPAISHRFAFSLGLLTLQREFYGYNSTDITASNVAAQEGIHSSSNTQNYILFRYYYIYNLSPGIDIQAGGGYLYAPNQVRRIDSPAGTDERGNPKNMSFNLSGINLSLGSIIVF